MISFKEIIIHRFRDFDAALRSNRKIRLLTYVFLRQFSKFFGTSENKLKHLIKVSKSRLKGFIFNNRAESLDFLFASKYYEPETTSFITSGDGIFLDIGAHIGRMSVLSSRNFDKIYSFEPQKSTFKILSKNIESNKIKNVKLFNFPLSDKARLVNLSGLEMNTGTAKIVGRGSDVETKTLDSVIKSEKIDFDKIRMVKIDVEGHELEVLKGGKDFLNKSNCKLVIECFELNELENFLSKYGYRKVKVLDFYNFVFEKG